MDFTYYVQVFMEHLQYWIDRTQGTIVAVFSGALALLLFAACLMRSPRYAKFMRGFRKSARFIAKEKSIDKRNVKVFETKCVKKFPKVFRGAWANFTLSRNNAKALDYFTPQMCGEKNKTGLFYDIVIAAVTCGNLIWFLPYEHLSMQLKLTCILVPLVVMLALRFALAGVCALRARKLAACFVRFQYNVQNFVRFDKRAVSAMAARPLPAAVQQALEKQNIEDFRQEQPICNQSETRQGKLDTLVNRVDELLEANVSVTTLKHIANMIKNVRDKDYTSDEEKSKLNVALGKIYAKIA